MSSLETIKANIKQYCDNNFNFSFDPTNPVVKLHEPTFEGDEIFAVTECMLKTRVTMGPHVKKFEKEYAGKYGWQNGVMVNSGSTANLLAISSLVNPDVKDHLKPGDEVIVPALSWSTTVWPIIQCGLVPVLVDSNLDTLNIDPKEIEKAISSKTKAVMIVPIYGNPCDMDAIVGICKKHGLHLIEDCCESMGAYYDKKPVGKFGKVATFSFYFSHHISTMEGGICVTDDFAFAENMRILRAHGWVREVEDKKYWTDKYPDIDPKFLFVNAGYNIRPMEVSGAMGSIQLPKLEAFIKKRRENAEWLKKRLSKYSDVLKFQQETPKADHSWFGFAILVNENAPFSVKDICTHLETENIETRPLIAGNIAAQPAMKLFNHRISGSLENATYVMKQGFSFGIHQHVCEKAREYIASRIDDFMKQQGIF